MGQLIGWPQLVVHELEFKILFHSKKINLMAVKFCTQAQPATCSYLKLLFTAFSLPPLEVLGLLALSRLVTHVQVSRLMTMNGYKWCVHFCAMYIDC